MKIVRPYSRPLLPTQLWLSPKGTALHDVEGAILEPPGHGRPTQRLIDLKQWAINGQPTDAVLAFRQKVTEARKISLEATLSLFFEQLYFGAANDFNTAEELYLLLPAIRDEIQRRAYRRLLQRTARSLDDKSPIHFLFEPEMTLEYFRLIRGDLDLRTDVNDVFLIIDCGALTCNVTTVITSRTGEVSHGLSGHSRRALNAIPGSTDNRAGRYVDRALLAEARDSVPMPDSDEASLSLIEAVKIETALGRRPTALIDPSGTRSWQLTPARLRAMSDHLLEQYQPTLQDVLDRTHDQLSGTALYKEHLEKSGVRDGAALARTLRGVILAGGTSQLPGFREALWRTLDIPADTPHFVVGQEYPFVAALGAMAHVLDRRGYLRKPLNSRTDEPATPLAASLQDDIYCIWRVNGNGESKSFLLVSRDAWPGGFSEPVRSSLPGECRGKKLSVTLVWGPEGHTKDEFLVTSDSHWFEVDCSQTVAHIELSASRGGEELKLHTSGRKAKTRYYYLNTPPIAAPERTHVEQSPLDPADDTLFAEACKVLVIDFGMSKTVVVSGEEAGPIRPADFVELSRSAQSARPLPPGWTLLSGAGATAPAPTVPPPPSPIEYDPAPRHPPPATLTQPPPSAALDTIAIPPADPPPLPAEVPVVVRSSPAPGEEPSPPDITAQADTAPLRAQDQAPLTLLPLNAVVSEEQFLRDALALAGEHALDIAVDDLVFLHLATSVRPMVLFTGAPGVGKTSLAMFYAALLGCTQAARTCVFAPVQASWISDDPLLGREGCLIQTLRQGVTSPDLLQVAIFDEFNLSRPEYYLSRLLTALDYDTRLGDDCIPRDERTQQPRLVIFATLNIDEVARPPADKILDRSFVLSPTPPEMKDPLLLARPRPFAPVHRISAARWIQWSDTPTPMSLPADLATLVRIFDDFERNNAANHHESVAPSRRALLDLAHIAERFKSAALDDLGVTRMSILDRAVAGRVLPRVRGEHRRIKPLLDALAMFFDGAQWPICGRHVRSMLGRTEFGFVSFWV